MAQRFTMRDNGDATYNIDDDEMGVTIADRVSWSRADYLWHHLNAGVLAVNYLPTGVRLERTDRVGALDNMLAYPLSQGGMMDRSGVTLSGILITDPVAEVTDKGRVAVFTMTGGEVVIPADTGVDTSAEGAIPDDALLAEYYETRDEARTTGNTYIVVVPDGVAQPALRHLRRGRSVTVHGRLDPATGRVSPDLLNSTPFLAYEGREGWIVESHATGGGPV